LVANFDADQKRKSLQQTARCTSKLHVQNASVIDPLRAKSKKKETKKKEKNGKHFSNIWQPYPSRSGFKTAVQSGERGNLLGKLDPTSGQVRERKRHESTE
jgi:hypothetical protein